MVNEETSLGEIKISHTVVASIVKLASMEVEGVASVAAGGLVEDLAGMFTRRTENGSGIRVEEDDHGRYNIVVRLHMNFGVELARAAYEVQSNVREQVTKMTNKEVAKVDVLIDGVKLPDKSRSTAPERTAWHESDS